MDRTVRVAELVRGAVLRAGGAAVHPSGKGVNVSRVLRAAGVATVAVAPLGGASGTQLAALAAQEGVELAGVPIAGAVRSNLSLVEPDGTVTKVNEPGPRLSAGECAALLAAVEARAGGRAWVAGCGSLPEGAPGDLYARVVALGRAAGARVAVDTSGPALMRAVEAGADLVKPNAPELAEAVGRPLATLGDAVDGARALRAAGAGAVLVSLGADGALLVDGEGAVHGEAPVAALASAVGAGDALLGGFLAAGGSGRAALACGLAWAAASCAIPDSGVPRATDVDVAAAVVHERVHAGRLLRD